MVVEKSVQCGLSELFIINSHVEANSGLSVMYILPSYESRDRFVSARVQRLYNRNPFYIKKKEMTRALKGPNRISLSSFGKGIINFVGSNVEREFVEFPADSVYIDEKDRCDQNNLTLVPGRLTYSNFKFQREISNPTVEGFGIDSRYQASSKGKWFIRCDRCNHWFTPDMFIHLVREIGNDQYEVRDPDYVKYERSPFLICDKCESKVDRLGKGEWVHERETDYRGFRISQLFSPKTDLGNLLWEADGGFFSAFESAVGKQVFFNTRLGLPYSASDARITEADLDLCQESYTFPYISANNRSVFIGVDVNKTLNVIVRERIRKGDQEHYLLIDACTVPDFSALNKLIERYKPRFTVVDALPEGHSVESLKAKFNNVFSCFFLDSALSPTVNKNDREIKIDRTTIIDNVKSLIDDTQLLLPKDAKNRIPTYYAHMTAPTRVLEINELKPDKSRFVWVAATPDHYLFAEVYCRVASMLAPHRDIFDAYMRQNEEMRSKSKERIRSDTTPDQMLRRLQQANMDNLR